MEERYTMEEISKQMAQSGLTRRHSNRQTRYNMRSGEIPRVPSNRVSKTISAGNSPRDWNRQRSVAYEERSRQVLPLTQYVEPLYRYHQHYPDLVPMKSDSQSRPMTWHPRSQQAAWATVCRRPDLAQWGLIDYISTTAPQGPPTPSLYPTSEGISPILPVSPLISTFGLDGSQMHDFPDVEPWLALSDDITSLPQAQLQLDKAPQVYAGLDVWPEKPRQLPLYTQSFCQDVTSFPTSSQSAIPTPFYDPPTCKPKSPFMEQQPGTVGPPRPSVPSEVAILSPGNTNLVALGLYDTPAPFTVQQHTVLISTCSLAQPCDRYVRGEGKGLKLEETWEPPPMSKLIDDDQVDGEGELFDLELPPPAGAAVYDGIDVIGDDSLPNRSFFFDDNDEDADFGRTPIMPNDCSLYSLGSTRPLGGPGWI